MTTPNDVTAWLRDQIESGNYPRHSALPTLTELNHQFFGENAGPAPGRNAYAPLIAAGMVEARQGRYGGHFVKSLTPASSSAALAGISATLADMADTVEALQSTKFFVVEFQEVHTGVKFGECLHTSLDAAKSYAVEMMHRLGVERDFAQQTVDEASFVCADAGKIGVRIYDQDLTDKAVNTQRQFLRRTS